MGVEAARPSADGISREEEEVSAHGWTRPSGTFVFPPAGIGYGGVVGQADAEEGRPIRRRRANGEERNAEENPLQKRRRTRNCSRDEWEEMVLDLQSRTRERGEGKRGRERLEELRERVRRRIAETRPSGSAFPLTEEQRLRIAANRAAAKRKREERLQHPNGGVNFGAGAVVRPTARV